MKKLTIAFALSFAPAILAAQMATTATSATADVSAKAGRSSVTSAANVNTDVPRTYSAESQAKLNATFAAAREKSLPERPIRDRIAEGQAKGASEAQVVVAAQRTEMRLEAAQSAILRAGRQPNDEALIRAEHAMAAGATSAQVEAAVRRTAPERSIVVELDALVATTNGNANANVGVNAMVGAPKTGAAASATGAATTAVTGAGAAVTGGAAAGLGAVIKPPV